jgi:hypothetical protein
MTGGRWPTVPAPNGPGSTLSSGHTVQVARALKARKEAEPFAQLLPHRRQEFRRGERFERQIKLCLFVPAEERSLRQPLLNSVANRMSSVRAVLISGRTRSRLGRGLDSATRREPIASFDAGAMRLVTAKYQLPQG